MTSLGESCRGARGGLRSRSFHRKKTLWEERELSQHRCGGSVPLVEQQLWVVSPQCLQVPFLSLLHTVIEKLQVDRDLLTLV